MGIVQLWILNWNSGKGVEKNGEKREILRMNYAKSWDVQYLHLEGLKDKKLRNGGND